MVSTNLKKVQFTPSPDQYQIVNRSASASKDQAGLNALPSEEPRSSYIVPTAHTSAIFQHPGHQDNREFQETGSPHCSGVSKPGHRLADKLMTPERATRELFTVEELFVQPRSQSKSKTPGKMRIFQTENSNIFQTQPNSSMSQIHRPASKSPLNRSGSVGKSVGTRLYNQGILSHSKKLAQMEHSLNIRHQLELAGASFTPEINKISEMIFERKPDRSKLPCHERLSKQAQSSQANKERIRRLHKEVEENRFEFKPKINPISKIIDAEKDKTLNQTNLSRHDLLFEDSRVRQMASPLHEQKHKNMQGITFQPYINPSSKKMVEESFLSRLDASVEKKRVQLKQHETSKSQVPNRAESRPKTRSKSPIQRTKKIGEMKSVYKYLYALGMDHHHKLEALINEEIEIAKGSTNKSSLTCQSKALLNQAIQKKILRIFELLDQKKTGNISLEERDIEEHTFSLMKEAANSSAVFETHVSAQPNGSVLPCVSPAEVNQLFEPFLKTLSQKKKSLDYSTFEYLFRRFIRGLNVEDRRKLLSLGDPAKEKKCEPYNQHLTFHPTISSKSQQILEQKQSKKELEASKLNETGNGSLESHDASQNGGKNFYTSQTRTRETFEPTHVSKLYQDLKECTFQPKVNTYHPEGKCKFNSNCGHSHKWGTLGSGLGAYSTCQPLSSGSEAQQLGKHAPGLMEIPLGYTSDISGVGPRSEQPAAHSVGNHSQGNQPYVDIIHGDDPVYRTADSPSRINNSN